MPPKNQTLANPILEQASQATDAFTLKPNQSLEVMSQNVPMQSIEPNQSIAQAPVSEPAIISPKTAIKKINQDIEDLNRISPQTAENQFDEQGRQIDPATGQPFRQATTPIETAGGAKEKTLQDKIAEARKTGRPFVVSNTGEINFSDAQGGTFGEQPKEQQITTFVNEDGQTRNIPTDQLSKNVFNSLLNSGWVMEESTGLLPSETGAGDTELQRLQDDAQQSEQQVEDLAQDFLNYNVDQDPDYQNYAQTINSQFDQLRRNMRKVNQSRQRVYETLGFRTGMAQYAPTIIGGIVGEEISQGNQRIADITRQEAQAIASARLAFQDGKWKEFSQKSDALKDIRNEKADALEKYNQTLVNANNFLIEQEKAEREAITFAQEQLTFMQEQEERMASFIAPNILGLSEGGELTFDPEEIERVARESNINPLVLRAAADNTIRELNKLSAEERKAELDRQNIESQIAIRELAEQRASALFPFQLEEAVKKAEGKASGEEVLSLRSSIRQEPAFKDLISVRNGFQNVKVGAGLDNAQGDLAIVNGYAKMLDPTGVVRPAEFDTVEAAQGFFERMINYPEKIATGARLKSDVRQKFLRAANELFREKRDTLSSDLEVIFDPIVKEKGLTLSDVLPEIFEKSKVFNTVKDFYDGGELNQLEDFKSKLYEAGIDENNTDLVEEAFKEYKRNFLTNESQTSLNGKVSRIADAIGQYESGGNYKARGPVVQSGQYKGERALGKYQIMPGNLPSWSREALGREVSEEEFLNSPGTQDRIANFKMAQLYKKYGTVEDVASAWFSGQPLARAGKRKDVLGTTVPEYVKNIKSIYQSIV